MEHAVDPQRRPALLHRHGPRVVERECGARRGHVGLVGAEQLVGQVAGPQDGLDLHLGVGQEAYQRSHLPRQRGAPGLDRPGEAHLHGQEDVVRAGVRVHVAQQRVVRRGAGRGRARHRLGGEIRPHALPVVGEGRREPLHPVHRRALAGQRRQDRGPRPHPAVLLVRAEQGEAATAQRERRGERRAPGGRGPRPCRASRRAAAARRAARPCGGRPDGRPGGHPSTPRPAAIRRPSGRTRAPSPTRRRERGCRWPPPHPPRWAPSAARGRRRRGRPPR